MEYDFFFIGGAHFLVTGSRESEKFFLRTPLYLAGAMMHHPPLIYKCNCGGVGYVLNQASLRVLVEQKFVKPECRPTKFDPTKT
jgi:hypothetical protein